MNFMTRLSWRACDLPSTPILCELFLILGSYKFNFYNQIIYFNSENVVDNQIMNNNLILDISKLTLIEQIFALVVIINL